MAKKKKQNKKFLTPEQIKESLWAHEWINDTLSPLSTQPYWDITKKIIPDDEVCLSGVFATNYAGSLVHKLLTIIATDKHVYFITEIAGYVTYKVIGYDEFMEVNLYQDQYLPSQIYIDIYLTKFRFYQLETQDPSSTLHFKKTIISQQIAHHVKHGLTHPNSRTLWKKTGLSIWRFFWRKIRFLMNIRLDNKQRKLSKKQQKLDKKNKSNNEVDHTVHVESL